MRTADLLFGVIGTVLFLVISAIILKIIDRLQRADPGKLGRRIHDQERMTGVSAAVLIVGGAAITAGGLSETVYNTLYAAHMGALLIIAALLMFLSAMYRASEP